MQCPWLLFSVLIRASIATARESYSGTPVLQPFSFPHDLTSGEDAIFRCVVKSGRPPYQFRWLKDDQDVSVTERLTTSVVSERVATLNVRRVTVGDSGNYTCSVSDFTGVESAVTATLGIPGLSKLREFAFPEEVSLGEKIIIGYVDRRGTSGPYDIRWHEDGRKVNESERVSITARGATLRIVGL
ncbi:hypothetical protein MRX96_050895 [Rhipicephalus microplus]